uniref:Lipase n=1 Tax=Escherichia coli TaxID=562 RepID=A0A8E4ICR2_ECOLX|nr:lipase [Escherichia coli]
MSPPTELSDLLAEDLTTPAGAVFGSMALVSWSRIFDNANLSHIIHDQDIPLMETIALDCIEDTDQGLPILPEVELLGTNFAKANPAETSPWQNIIQDNSPRPNDISVPMFIAQGSIDPVVDPKITKQWAVDLCKENPSVFYKVYEGKSHLDVVAPAVKDTLPWIHDRFANTAAPSNCVE